MPDFDFHSETHASLARIDFCSDLDILPIVDALSQRIGRMAGLDEESIDWIKVATREAVANAIIHGNSRDPGKRVYLEFDAVGDAARPALSIRVRDEGCGFNPDAVPDPLAAHNLLRPGGRGILLMRSVLDEFGFQQHPEGGTEAVLVKRAALPATT